MHRRALLATFGASVAGLAGCMVSGPSAQVGDSQFDGEDIPPMDGVSWFHDADGSTEAYVRPERETVELPASPEFTFVNDSDQREGCGHWHLYKLHDGAWFQMGWGAVPDFCREVPPGKTASETYRLFRGHPDEDSGMWSWGHLGGGVYGAVTGYGHETRSTGAVFRVEAPEITVEPTDSMAAERNGDTVTVSAHGGSANTESQSYLTLERVEDGGDRLVPEQVMQHRSLRNTLGFVDSGVEQVTLVTTEPYVPGRLRYDGGWFTFDGRNYRLEENQPSSQRSGT